MSSFRLVEAVATTARNLPSRSSSENARRSSWILPASAHSRTALLAPSAPTKMRAPVSIRPPILGSPTLPAPTTRHCFPASFRNIGKRLVTVSSRWLCRVSNTCRRQIASDGVYRRPRQKLPQLGVGVPGKELTQVLASPTRGQILPQQSFDGVRNLGQFFARH